MSDSETLKGFIDDAAKELTKARDALDAVPRPKEPCGAHDAIFALTKAQTNGILALLRVQSDRIADPLPVIAARYSEQGRETALVKAASWVAVLRPIMWPIAVVAYSPFAGTILEKIITAIK